MKHQPDIPGLRLSALPPVYEFTHHTDFVYGSAAVFLLDHDSEPHWFATDGYSAMLTPALLDEENADALFDTAVGERCYRPEHIKALFRHVKHGTVIYDAKEGTLTSPDGIMIVPAYVPEADPGEEPERVRPPSFEPIFQGEEVPQSSFEFGWKFVVAMRAAFRAKGKDADLTMTCLDGHRVLLDVHEPYRGQVLIALKRQEKEAPAQESAEEIPGGSVAQTRQLQGAVAELKKGMQRIADMPGVAGIEISMGEQNIQFSGREEDQT